MTIRKIADLLKPCQHPDHDPPSHMFFPDGVYEHKCPGCGKTTTFVVSNPTL